MAFLLSLQSVTKSFGRQPLFRSITFGIEEGERLGLIGPNGSGKSTLLKIIAGLEPPDDGAVSRRRGLRTGYVAQEDVFSEGATPRFILLDALSSTGMDEHEREFAVARMIDRVGFTDADQPAGTLSGGWRKRLAIARELIAEPDLLLLDEPTNHLDIEGILWLEKLAKEMQAGLVVVTHDRYFLESVTTRVMELSRAYREGFLSVNGHYSDFLEAKAAYLAAQASYQDALETKMRREVEWLRRQPQARATKAQYRIDAAGRLIEEVAEVRQRNAQERAADIEFSASRRQTREMLAAKGIAKSLGGRELFRGLDVVLAPGRKLGIVGRNGSGKSTLLRVLIGEAEADTGTIRRADGLRVVYFDQNRAPLDPKESLRRALSPNGETVVFQGRPMHVAGWAQRFLFRPEQIETPVGSLSGGERARVLIAQLMLKPADVLILDEPTNDLDIPSLEVLEESLREFPGALVLVTHDRYLLDRVCTEVLALDGKGGHAYLADYSQWERLLSEVAEPARPAAARPSAPATRPPRLTASERKELANIEQKITLAEEEVARLEASLASSEVATDASRLAEVWQAVNLARDRVSALYNRWEELETRKSASEG
jgi:ATP-binding cassette subfamily F protein uup